MGKRRQAARSQDVLILTGTNDVEPVSLETNVLYVASPPTAEAWELDSGQQAKNEKSGRYVQVVSEISKKPLRIYRNRPSMTGKSTDIIASQQQDTELTFMTARSSKNSMLLWLGIICALVAVIIGIIVLVNLRQSAHTRVLSLAPFALAVLGAIMTRNNGHKKGDIISVGDVKQIIQDEKGVVDCLIFIEKTRTYGHRRLDKSLIPTESIERKLKGQPVHLLGLDDKGLWAIESPLEAEENDSPTDLFMSLEYEVEVNEVYGLSEAVREKIKLGVFIALVFALLIVLFLIATIAMGGG